MMMPKNPTASHYQTAAERLPGARHVIAAHLAAVPWLAAMPPARLETGADPDGVVVHLFDYLRADQARARRDLAERLNRRTEPRLLLTSPARRTAASRRADGIALLAHLVRGRPFPESADRPTAPATYRHIIERLLRMQFDAHPPSEMLRRFDHPDALFLFWRPNANEMIDVPAPASMAGQIAVYGPLAAPARGEWHDQRLGRRHLWTSFPGGTR